MLSDNSLTMSFGENAYFITEPKSEPPVGKCSRVIGIQIDDLLQPITKKDNVSNTIKPVDENFLLRH